MVIIPRVQPVFENLNIYYLDIKKLIEHYQGEIGSGGVYFKSRAAEGVIFFDKDELLNGLFQGKNVEIAGTEAVEMLLQGGDEHNFNVNVYKIPSAEIYFWASIPSAEKIYKDLSTEFTDLERLVKKMSSEKLTGFIDVAISNGKDRGCIFLINGKIIGGSYSWKNGVPSQEKEDRQLLIRMTKDLGGTFNVCRIPQAKTQTEHRSGEIPLQQGDSPLEMLEELLGIFESVLALKKKMRTEFNKLLKKKFVDNADKYAFLDPFAGEFEYANRRIRFEGDASQRDLVSGVIESVKDMAQELGVWLELQDSLASWSNKYSAQLESYGIEL